MMNKKLIIIPIAIVIIASGLMIFFSGISQDEVVNLSKHGTISTGMGSAVLGSPDAEITLIEFGDYQCHQCYNWFHKTKPVIFQNYIETGRSNFIFVDMAFLGKDSITAAQASYCAEDQGKYWEYHDLLYNSQEPKIDNGWANSERLKAFAFNLGLDNDLFKICLDSGKYLKRVQQNISEGKKLGVSGTPTFLIVGPDGQQEKLVGAQPYEIFKKLMDSMN